MAGELTLDELVEIRHYLHQHPELSLAEYQTTAFIAQKLDEWDIDYSRAGLKTGLVAEIGPQDATEIVAIRADIDALPIQEQTALSFASVNEGVMHACGHDLHMTSLLVAAYALKQMEQSLSGRVRLFFQPAEEVNGGALQLIEQGYLDNVKAIAGFHNMPDLPVGDVAILNDVVFAGVDRFKVTLTGLESHAAMPQNGADPIVAVSGIISALQTIVARNVDPMNANVLSVTHVESGSTWNVLPTTAWFEGTIRTFNNADQVRIKERFVRLVEDLASGYGVEATVVWVMDPPAPVTVNDNNLAAAFRAQMPTTMHQVTVRPSSVGEDFSHYTLHVPAVFGLIGSNGGAALHQATLTIDDGALPYAIDYYLNAVEAMLNFSKEA